MQAEMKQYRRQPYVGDGFRHGILFRREHAEVLHDPDPNQLDQLAEEQVAHWQAHYCERGQQIGLDEVQRYKREWQRGFQTSEEQDFPRPRQEMTVSALPWAKLLLSGLCAVQFAPAHSMYYDHKTCVRWPEGTRFSTPYEIDYWRGPLVIDVLLPPAHQFPDCCPYMLWEPEKASIYGTTPPASNWGLLIGKIFPSHEETLGAIRRDKVYEDCRRRNVWPCLRSGCYAVYDDTFRCARCGDFACLEHRSGSLCMRCLDDWIDRVAEKGGKRRSGGLYLP